MSPEEILNQRKNKFLKIGRNKGFISNPENLSSIQNETNNLDEFFKSKKSILISLTIILLLIVLINFLFGN